MRYLIGLLAFSMCLYPIEAIPQASASDKALLEKTRSLYDAPFARNLFAFDCAVQFDWKQLLVNHAGSLAPFAVPTVDSLQAIKHRVFVDRTGAVISDIPKSPDLSKVANGTVLEASFRGLGAAGINAWLPFSADMILPSGLTKYSFKKVDSGYQLTLNGRNLSATLLFTEGMRLTTEISQPPEPMRLSAEFIDGPGGFLLSSLNTVDSTDLNAKWDDEFAYTYQSIQGFQLPESVTIQPRAGGTWRYTFTDCKVTTGTRVVVKSSTKM